MSQEWINLLLVIVGVGVFSAILGSLVALLDKYERLKK